jgi:hypothetical protein
VTGWLHLLQYVLPRSSRWVLGWLHIVSVTWLHPYVTHTGTYRYGLFAWYCREYYHAAMSTLIMGACVHPYAPMTDPTMIKGEADARVDKYLTELQEERDLNKYEAVTLALEKARARKLGIQNND